MLPFSQLLLMTPIMDHFFPKQHLDSLFFCMENFKRKRADAHVFDISLRLDVALRLGGAYTVG